VNIRILESAKIDLQEGFYLYEMQQTEIENYFIESLISDIESLRLNAGIHSIHFDKFYRLLSKRFPFAVYYRIQENEVRIYAILDCRRDPAWIRARLQ
jgi:hypothetical protein